MREFITPFLPFHLYKTDDCMKLFNNGNQIGTGCKYGMIQISYRTFRFFKYEVTGKIIPIGGKVQTY